MAKKKGGAKAPATPAAEKRPDAEPSADSPSEKSPERAESPQAAEQPEAGSGDVAEQLKAAQAEIAALKSQLKDKDDEIAKLKQGAPAVSSSGNGAKTEDMQKLQERLAQLKKEQMEADAARDAAWRQLKSVVQEISKLSAPAVALPSPSLATPTQA